jgi:hypothetical protein
MAVLPDQGRAVAVPSASQALPERGGALAEARAVCAGGLGEDRPQLALE